MVNVSSRALEKMRNLQAEHDAWGRLAATWPESIEAASLAYINMAGQMFTVTIEATDRKDALQTLASFELEPLALLKGGGTTSIQPVRMFDDAKIKRADEYVEHLLPAYWEFPPSRFGEGPCLHAWTKLADPVHLRVRITDDPARISAVRTVGGNGRLTLVGWNIEDAPLGDVLRFASYSAGEPGPTKVYFTSESGGGAPGFDHYLEGRQTIHRRLK